MTRNDEVSAVATSAPSEWVVRFASCIAPGGHVLDVACGAGRHARWLASRGFQVEAVDRDPQLISELQGARDIFPRCADLELDAWPFAASSFAAVIVTNYLHRPRLDALLDVLRPGGVLIYETFMVGNEHYGRPSRPEFLLKEDELYERVRPRLRVLAFEQGLTRLPKPACVQRICAVRNSVLMLP